MNCEELMRILLYTVKKEKKERKCMIFSLHIFMGLLLFFYIAAGEFYKKHYWAANELCHLLKHLLLLR